MQIIYLPEAEKDLAYWEKTGKKAVLKKIFNLTKAILEDPYNKIGKPRVLKFNFSPNRSCSIMTEHRNINLA